MTSLFDTSSQETCIPRPLDYAFSKYQFKISNDKAKKMCIFNYTILFWPP